MTKLEQMIQQHILEHDLRLKHVDELLERARAGAAKAGAGAEEVESAARERDELSGRVESLKRKPQEQWSGEEFEQYGPMAVWDTLAKRLEKLVERFER